MGWQLSTKRSHTGTGSLYYGDPATGSFDNGAANQGSVTGPAVTLPAGQKAALHFWVYMDTETRASFDVLTVAIGGKTLWTKDPASTLPIESYKTWTPVAI